MKRRTGMTIVAVLAGMLALSGLTAAAAAAKGKPAPVPVDRSCQHYVDSGAWVTGEYDRANGYYLVSSAVGEPIALPACFDLLAEHAVEGAWRVEWAGTVLQPPSRGLQLVFEKWLHEGVYATTGKRLNTNGLWVTEEFKPDPSHFVFVAMPHQGDTWTSVEIKVYPPTQP